MLTEANLLVLDEPTNDLDIETLNILEESLLDFDGALILVTHDRYFLERVSTDLLALSHGESESFSSLTQWEAWRQGRQVADAAIETKSPDTKPYTKIDTKPDTKIDAKIQEPKPAKKKLSYKDQRELDSMESNIAQAEKELARLTEESTRGDIASQPLRLSELSRQMAEVQERIERLYNRWSELEGS
jgi:ATP-binding cassette subfamily F protein uup